ncbi:hypothetical protein [Moorena sp. SIO4G3]|uniref:hypothetical protein n=1 Tax=Moorena sp. SIO4G3 TaxID=2607821 RepID=UPI00142CFC21|nr:hypothetical protein [Moorena sp. SIO4G3]NEO77850.1 hypothetical protein [Moorena sp. SIO4G3]
MLKKLTFVLVAILCVFCTSVSAAHADDTHDTIKYGNRYHIENLYQWTNGGYLDTKKYCEFGLCVSTSTSSNRDQGSGTWIITSANGKANGTDVVSGDVVYLYNGYKNNTGGYLYDNEGSKLLNPAVSTLYSSQEYLIDDYQETIKWKLTNGGGGPIKEFDSLHIESTQRGLYLDTNGYGCDGNHLCVLFTDEYDRDQESTIWRFISE